MYIEDEEKLIFKKIYILMITKMELRKFYTNNGNTAIVYNSSITVYFSPK